MAMNKLGTSKYIPDLVTAKTSSKCYYVVRCSLPFIKCTILDRKVSRTTHKISGYFLYYPGIPEYWLQTLDKMNQLVIRPRRFCQLES